VDDNLGNNIISNPYQILGLWLCLAGAVFTPISYFLINSVPLAAVGLTAIMIGFTCIALANTRPYISPETCQLLLKTGMKNTAALLEELGLMNKAVYLPSTMWDGDSQAIIPLKEDTVIQRVKEKIPGRLIVRYGIKPDDMAIAVSTPGSICIDMLETKLGPTSGEIEAATNYILMGVLDIAQSVSVIILDKQMYIEVHSTRLQYEDTWYYRCLGSPIASIVATISSEALQLPIRIKEENFIKGKIQITLEVLP